MLETLSQFGSIISGIVGLSQLRKKEPPQNQLPETEEKETSKEQTKVKIVDYT